VNVSRKDFFKQSLFSFGKAVCSAAEALDSRRAAAYVPEEERELVPVRREGHVARADNGRCLAKNCGCFACVELCEAQAIQVVMGEGIRVDALRCTGCGSCEFVCPVTPRAILLAERSAP
jgi:MinD superfamily P-loop ATPase